MKKILLLISVFAVLSGCSKNDDITNDPSLTGKWEYRGVSCYCTPVKDSSAVKPGNGNIISFSEDIYKHYKDGILIKKGTYRTRMYDDTRKPIIYDEDTTAANVTFFRIDKKILTLYGTIPLAADGPEYHYEKQ
jgi:hypothetical protein